MTSLTVDWLLCTLVTTNMYAENIVWLLVFILIMYPLHIRECISMKTLLINVIVKMCVINWITTMIITLEFLILTKAMRSVCIITIKTLVDATESMVSHVAPLLTEKCSMITRTTNLNLISWIYWKRCSFYIIETILEKIWTQDKGKGKDKTR